jgi:hypothetical protein
MALASVPANRGLSRMNSTRLASLSLLVRFHVKLNDQYLLVVVQKRPPRNGNVRNTPVLQANQVRSIASRELQQTHDHK